MLLSDNSFDFHSEIWLLLASFFFGWNVYELSEELNNFACRHL